jgi:hypothetical protein
MGQAKMSETQTRTFELDYDEWCVLSDELRDLYRREEDAARNTTFSDEVAHHEERAAKYRRMRESLLRPVFHAT